MTLKELAKLYDRHFEKLELLEDTVSELDLEESEVEELIITSRDLQHSFLKVVAATKELLEENKIYNKID